MVKIANIVFNPFTNDSRVIKESISLSNAGYKVEVIAHGDKNLKEYEEQENFIVRRFAYLDRKVTKSKLSKLKIYLSYLKQSVNYCKNFDILHCNDLNTLPIGFIIKKFYNKNIKIVYDAHEYETEINGLKGINKTITKIAEKFLIKYADATICVSNAIADEYVKLYNIEKPALVLNTPAFQKIEKKDIFREVFSIKKEQTIFLYQGALSKGRGIEIVFETFKQMQDNKSVVVFMGYGELEELVKTTAKEYKNIYFHKAVSPDILLDYTSSTDFGLSIIEDSCLSYRYCLPNKMFEYAMADIPIIVSNLFEMKKVVEEYEIGVVLRENSSNGLGNAIKKAKSLDRIVLEENIQKVKEIYNWEEQEKNLLNVYNNLWG